MLTSGTKLSTTSSRNKLAPAAESIQKWDGRTLTRLEPETGSG